MGRKKSVMEAQLPSKKMERDGGTNRRNGRFFKADVFVNMRRGNAESVFGSRTSAAGFVCDDAGDTPRDVGGMLKSARISAAAGGG